MQTSTRAFESYLQGFKLHNQMTRKQNQLAQIMFRMAIKEDRKFARAYGHLAYTRLIAWLNGWDPSPTPPKDLRKTADRAVALDPDDYDNLWSKAGVYLYTAKFDRRSSAAFACGLGLFDEALAKAADGAIDYNADGLRVDKADALFFTATSREPVDEAIAIIRKAIGNVGVKNPRRFLWSLAWAYYERAYFTGREADLVQSLKALQSINNPSDTLLKNFIATYSALGWRNAAKRKASEFMCRNSKYTVAVEDRWPYRDAKRLKRWKDHLRQAGLPG